jgi:hypothetical protein
VREAQNRKTQTQTPTPTPHLRRSALPILTRPGRPASLSSSLSTSLITVRPGTERGNNRPARRRTCKQPSDRSSADHVTRGAGEDADGVGGEGADWPGQVGIGGPTSAGAGSEFFFSERALRKVGRPIPTVRRPCKQPSDRSSAASADQETLHTTINQSELFANIVPTIANGKLLSEQFGREGGTKGMLLEAGPGEIRHHRVQPTPPPSPPRASSDQPTGFGNKSIV